MKPAAHLCFAAIAALAIGTGTDPIQDTAGTPDPLATPDGVVDALYDAVTIEAGTTPDWDHVKTLFLDGAVIVLRTGPDKTSVFTRDGFVQDFVDFLSEPRMKDQGFVERIVRRDSMVFGDIAHILVLYEAVIPGSERPPQQGVDSIQLVRQGERWKIASIVNELPLGGRELPAALRDESP